jgi:hypothetical protein
MTLAIPPAFTPDLLYAKSQVYIRRAFRARDAGDIEEYRLWASLALELLGKAALARVSPTLVADPTHQESLFGACGVPIGTDLKTITAKTLVARLSDQSVQQIVGDHVAASMGDTLRLIKAESNGWFHASTLDRIRKQTDPPERGLWRRGIGYR